MRDAMLEREVFMREFGKDMRRARREQGLTQSDLAAQMQLAGYDVDGLRISRLERAERTLTAEELLVLASILFIDLNGYSQTYMRRHQPA